MTLRRRLSMLAGVYADVMPYSDPHTAGPALWALRQNGGSHFEVSVTTVAGTTQWRKGLELLAIAMHRQQFGRSPAVNFGRMPHGFRKSSGNNQRLALAGKRFRGGPCETCEGCHVEGIPPIGPLMGDPQDASWCGHEWSDWQPLGRDATLPSAPAHGLYRIRDADKPGLLYIGEGIVAARLSAHWRKSRTPGTLQGDVFSTAMRLEVSQVLNDGWMSHQRLELECDLIGSHVLSQSAVPPAQFVG